MRRYITEEYYLGYLSLHLWDEANTRQLFVTLISHACDMQHQWIQPVQHSNPFIPSAPFCLLPWPLAL
jgi:hypothetical protein